MLYEDIKQLIKTYLVNSAKDTEEMCKRNDAEKTKSEVQESITALEALLENTKSEQAKKPIEESIKKLRAEDKKIVVNPGQETIKAFSMFIYAHDGDYVCAIPISKEALKYRTGENLQSKIVALAEQYHVTAKQTEYALLLDAPASRKDGFFLQLAIEAPYIHLEEISIHGLVASVSAAKVPKCVAALSKKADEMLTGLMDNVLTAVKTTKKAKSIEGHVDSLIDHALGDDRGYFTVQELVGVLHKSRVCVQNHIRDGLLQSTKTSIPGKKGRLLVVDYDSVIDYKQKYYHSASTCFSMDNKNMVKAVKADIAAKHSDRYMMAVHNINENDLACLKGQKKSKTAKKEQPMPEQNGDEIKQFFREHGVDAKAFKKAKAKFGLDGRILHGHRMAVMHESN